MATLQIRLPNGQMQTLSHPDDWSDEQVKKAIYKHFPKNEVKKPSLTDQAIRYGVKDPLIGMENLGEGLINAPHNIAAIFSDQLANKIPKLEEMDYSSLFGIKPEDRNTADKLIQFSPELLTSFALPETRLGSLGKALESVPKAGKYLKTALGNALSQGTFAASQSPDDQGSAAIEAGSIAAPFSALSKAASEGSPTLRKLSRVLLAAGGGGLGYEGAKTVGAGEIGSDLAAALGAAAGYRGVSPEKRAREDLLKGVKGTPYQDTLEAGKRLGLTYLTPAEASGNPFAGAAQGNIGKTEEGALKLYERGTQRAESETASINRLLNTVFEKEKLEPHVRKAYEKVYPQQVSDDVLSPLKDNEVFKKAVRVVQSRPAFKESLKGIPENSIGYLDHIKQAMDDLIEKAPRKEGRIIQKTKDQLLNITDAAVPEYEEARNIAQREIVRRNIEQIFKNNDFSGSIMGKYLKNTKNYNELLNSLKNVPEAQDQLKDMKHVFHRLINIPTAKNAEALSRTAMSKDRNDQQFWKRFIQEFTTGGKYDKAAVELITNPKWADELEKLNKISSNEKFIKYFSDIVGKAGAQSVAQKSKEDKE